MRSRRWWRCFPIFAGLASWRLAAATGGSRAATPRAASVLAFDPDDVLMTAVRSDPPAGDVELRTATVESVDIPDGSANVVRLSWAL
jgi:hypothetical protein